MAEASGYILVSARAEMEHISDAFAESGRYALPVLEFEHSRSTPLVCFVVDESGALLIIARASRGVRAGTDFRRLNLVDIMQIEIDIDLSAIASQATPRHRKRLIRAVSAGGLLTPAQFRALVDALVAQFSQLSETLSRFSTSRAKRLSELSDEVLTQLAFQKEAVGTALELAGLDRSELQQWTPPSQDPPTSFLSGLQSTRQREDVMVTHDALRLPGFEFVAPDVAGTTVFRDDQGTQVVILIANRQPLEELTGADLIYYNEHYQSFVMVQYKAMERPGEEALFRVPNAQLDLEIARMEAILASLEEDAQMLTPKSYRISWSPFFLKFCPRIQFKADDSSLSHGMYLPLAKWKLLAESEDLTQPRGGRALTFLNVGRHFDNTGFAQLVGNGWIGTTPSQSTILEAAVKQTLETGRAAVIAVRSGPSRVPSR